MALGVPAWTILVTDPEPIPVVKAWEMPPITLTKEQEGALRNEKKGEWTLWRQVTSLFHKDLLYSRWASQVALVVKNPPANAGEIPRKIPCRRAWQPAPAFLPGESHGQRSLTYYHSYSCKQSDTTEVT